MSFFILAGKDGAATAIAGPFEEIVCNKEKNILLTDFKLKPITPRSWLGIVTTIGQVGAFYIGTGYGCKWDLTLRFGDDPEKDVWVYEKRLKDIFFDSKYQKIEMGDTVGCFNKEGVKSSEGKIVDFLDWSVLVETSSGNREYFSYSNIIKE